MKALLILSAVGVAAWLWHAYKSRTEQAPPSWRVKRDEHHHGSE